MGGDLIRNRHISRPSNREVAAALFLSPKTVEYHLTHVYRKLDIHSRAELVRFSPRR